MEALRGTNVEVAMLTGNVKGKARRFILENLAEGKIDILIAPTPWLKMACCLKI